MKTASVILLEHTPNPEQLIARAGRICTSGAPLEKILKNVSPESAAKMVNRLKSMRHLSTLEHVNFTWLIDGMSRVATHQLVRHRIASFSQASQRYIALGKDIPYRIPDSIAENPEALAEYDGWMDGASGLYSRLVALGVPGEDARYAMPHCVDSRIMVTMNARELIGSFFHERLCNRAQKEIRQVATEMYEQALEVSPTIFTGVGPSCVTDKCHQGPKSCGAGAQVNAEYEKRWAQYD